MLHLCQVDQPYSWERCHISKKYIHYGDFYYYDDEDGLIIALDVYNKMKLEEKRKNWDFSKLKQAANEREYEQMMREKTRAFLAQDVLKRQVNKGVYTARKS